MSDMQKMRYYKEGEENYQCFFQPAPTEINIQPLIAERNNNLPDPSQRFRILTPRPAPRGIY